MTDDAGTAPNPLDAILRDTLTSTYVDDAYYALLRADVAEWDARGTPLTGPERGTYEALVLHETWLLDRRRFEEWYGLYARECLYWVPAADPVADPAAADPRTGSRSPATTAGGWGPHRLAAHRGRLLPASALAHRPPVVGLRPGAHRPARARSRSARTPSSTRSASGHVLQTMAGWTGHVLVEEDGEWRIARKTVGLLDAERAHHNLTFLL